VTVLGNASYEIAVRALGQQEQALAELRARTGTLLTAASLIASFLGAEAIARNGLNDWVVLALLAFGVSVVLSIYLLLPNDSLVFALDAPETYEKLYDIRADDEEVQRSLIYWVQSFYATNSPTIRRLSRVFEVAGVSLVFEIGFLAAGLAVR
jgi:hypothetical protein